MSINQTLGGGDFIIDPTKAEIVQTDDKISSYLDKMNEIRSELTVEEHRVTFSFYTFPRSSSKNRSNNSYDI